MSPEEKRMLLKRAMLKEALAKEATKRPEPSTSVGESVLAGAGQGLTFGWGDEAVAALGAAKDVAAAKLGLRGDIGFSDAYQSYLPNIREKDKKAQEDNPGAFLAGSVGGGVATMAIPGANIGKIASAAGRTGAAAGIGAVTGAGASDSNPLTSPAEAEQFAKDVVLGGLLGAGGQAVGEVAPSAVKALQNIPSKLKDSAEKRAFKAAAGGVAAAYKKTTEEQRGKIGRELIDSGLIKFGDDADAILARVTDAKDEVGAGFTKLYDEIDSINPETVSGRDIAARLLDFADKIDMPGNEAQAKNLREIAGKYINMGNMSLRRAQDLKNNYKWSFGQSPSDLTLGKQVKNEINQSIGKAMDEAVGRFSSVADDIPMQSTGTGVVSDIPIRGPGGAVFKEASEARPDLGADFSELKRKYGILAEAQKHSREVASREAKNRDFGLTDNILAAGALAAGGPGIAGAAQAASVGALNKLARERGNAAMAVSADRIAELLQNSPDILGEFAVPLAAAAKKGAAAIASTHAALLSDPKYRDTVGGNELAAQAKEIESAKTLLAHRQQTQAWKATPDGQRWSTGLKASYPKTAAMIEQAAADLDPTDTEIVISDPQTVAARKAEIMSNKAGSSIAAASELSQINETGSFRVKVPPRVIQAQAPAMPAGRSAEDLLRILGG